MMSSAVKSMNKSSIHECDVKVLLEELGVVGMLRYLERYDNGGSGDYTKEKYVEKDISIDEIVGI